MSKNLTRKGLALGAVVALSSTLIAGSPAFAVDPVTLEPTTGTSFNTLVTESLKLTSLFTDAAQQGSEALKFIITDSSKKLSLANTYSDRASAGVNDAGEEIDDAVGTNLVAGDGIYVEAAGNVTGPTQNNLVLTPTGTTTFSVTVQSWLDYNTNNLIDSGEAASAVRTVKFVAAADVATTVTLTQPIQGDTQAAVKFALNDINNEQLTVSELGVYLTDANGAALDGLAANGTVIDTLGDTNETELTFSATTKLFSGKSGSFTALTKTGSVKAQVVFLNGAVANDAVTTATTLGAAASASATVRKVELFTADIVRAGTAVEIDDNGTPSFHVNRNTAFQLSAAATDSSTPAKAVVGSPVTVKITMATGTLSSTTGSVKSLTVNGTVYTSNTALPGQTGVASVATTTNADGEAIISLSSVGFAVGDRVTAEFTTENKVSSITVMAVAPVYTGFLTADTNKNGASANTDISITAKSAFSVAVSVVDQFGGVPANIYDARLVWISSTSRTTASTSVATSVSVPVVNGVATLTTTDNGVGTGVDTYDVRFSERVSGGGYVDAAATVIDTVDVNIVSNITAGKITSGGSNAAAGTTSTAGVWQVTSTTNALGLKTFANYDVRKVLGDQPNPAGGVRLVGAVQTAAGVAIKGAPVTVSGAGLLFKASGAAVYGLGSLTIQADDSGVYDVVVYSNKVNKQTVTITSGAAVQTAEITYVASATELTATALTIDAPASILPGRTLTVSGLLVDKYGNGVITSTATLLTVSYDGPGLPIATVPSDTDKDGKFSFKVLLGAADTGSATVTAKYDSNNDGDYTDTVDLVVTKTITIGAAAVVVVAPKAAVIATKNGRVYVTVNSPAGFKAYVKVGFSVKPSFTTTGSKLVSYYVGAGKRVAVRVYVRGGIVASQAVTVK